MKSTDDIIRRIKDGTLREDASVELKRWLPNKDMLAKVLVGLANAGGGHLIIGIEESAKGSKAVGLKEGEDVAIGMIESVCNEFSIHIYTTVTKANVKSNDILIVEIHPLNAVTYYSRSSSPERLYAYTRNEDGSTQKADDTKTYQKIYKYMTLETFMTCLYTGTWRFFEPNKWQDKYESRFYCAEYRFPNAHEAAPKLFATCVTRERNSEASWKVYAGGTGLNQHCLQLELNLVEFRKQLQASDFLLEEKVVTYEHDVYIENLHKPNNRNYHIYFQPFSRRNFISLLSLKRKAYEYEKEVRFFLIPKDPQDERSYGKQKSDYQDIPIEWAKLIKSARIDKHCSPAELKSLQQACFAAGINPKFSCGDLMGGGKPHDTPPSHSIDIAFDLFCIDDMQGSSRLTIK